jgi:hypothetical protein
MAQHKHESEKSDISRRYQRPGPLALAELVHALRTIADRIEKHQAMPVHEHGLGYEVFVDLDDRLVIRVSRVGV